MSFDGGSEEPHDPAFEAFLRLLRALPRGLALQAPVLSGIACLSGKGSGDAPPGLIQGRLDRRYARICVVQGELGKLDFRAAKPGAGLEDLVFSQTDFGVYEKISREDFRAFFDEGLEDFDDSFYTKNFMMDREAVRKTISHWYRDDGDCYASVGENPLILGIMRTLHASLDFTPLVQPMEVLSETEAILRFLQSQAALGDDALLGLAQNLPALYSGLLCSLDGLTVTHPDGMATDLFVQPGSSPPVLLGTFRPANKAHTIRLSWGC